MKKIIIILLLLFLVGCTQVKIVDNGVPIAIKDSNTTVEKSTKYETPDMVVKRVIESTDVPSFGEVI